VNWLLPKESPYRYSLALLSGAFLIWGLLRSLDDIVVAVFHASGMLHYATAMLIHLSFFSAYLLVSIPAGIYAQRLGYRRSLVTSMLLMTVGAGICALASLLYSFLLCLAGIFVMALGIAALQTVANPCISLFGPAKTATARLLLVQGFSSLGSILGPLAGILLFGAWSRHQSSIPLLFPRTMLSTIYLLISLCAVVLVVFISRYFTEKKDVPIDSATNIGLQLLRHRRLLFGVIATFLYVGSEGALLGHSIPYLSHHYTEGILPGTAAALLSVYWTCVLVGRLSAVSLLKGIDTRTLLQGACVVALLLIQVAVYHGGMAGGICLLATGLCNAVMFPSIFSLSIAGLREQDLPQASALLSTAICGGAVMPILSSILAERFGTPAAFILPGATYLAIALCSGIFFPHDYQLQTTVGTKQA
jgi:FHS family L-fucose permease-like MFS transporter